MAVTQRSHGCPQLRPGKVSPSPIVRPQGWGPGPAPSPQGLEAPHLGQMLPAGWGLSGRWGNGRSDRWGLARLWGFKGKSPLRAYVAGNQEWSLEVGGMGEVFFESRKRKQLAPARGLCSSRCEPPGGADSARALSDATVHASDVRPQAERKEPLHSFHHPSPIPLPLHPPSPPLLSGPVVHTRRGV